MSDPAPIRAAIIDDHEAIRLGVGAALQQHTAGQVKVVSSHETVDEFLADDVDADVTTARARQAGNKCIDTVMRP